MNIESQQTKPRARLFSDTSNADAAAPQPARKKLKKKKGKAKPRSASSASKPVKAERKAGARRKPARASAARTADGSSAVDQIYEENGGLKIFGDEINGVLTRCWFHLSANATGVMGKEYDRRKKACKKGKRPTTPIFLHHAVALVTGCPVRDFSNKRGGMTIDHKDENPGNNSLENLRVMRTELNLARKCDRDGVFRPRDKRSEDENRLMNHYQFGKPLFTYLKGSPQLWEKAKDCDELKDVGFFDNDSETDYQIKIRDKKTRVTITDDEARKRAVARKRAQGRAVFAFFKREDPDLFKGWKPERDAAGEWHWVEADFFDEFVAKWL